MTRLSRNELGPRARQGSAASNTHDLKTIPAPFSEDSVFSSPPAKQMAGDAKIGGKVALQPHLTDALAHVPELHFERAGTAVEEKVQSVTAFHVSRADGRVTHACEQMGFRESVPLSGEACYGATE